MYYPNNIKNRKNIITFYALFLISILFLFGFIEIPPSAPHSVIDTLRAGFLHPPESAQPGVYWYFMDGNMSKEGITEDLESMKTAGISNVIFLEVNVGVPCGPVDFLSETWLTLFNHAVDECRRLNIAMTLGIGPGWTGSGGPWVTANESMQELVSSSIDVSGTDRRKIILPVPKNKKPFFGERQFTPELEKKREDFYEDVAVVAFPTVDSNKKIKDIDEKALYYRSSYSSQADVKPFTKPYLIPTAYYDAIPKTNIIQKSTIIDLTANLQPDGTLNWVVPPGKWTIMRFGRRNNGALTRPAPIQGLGFESDKMDTTALNDHLNAYVGKIIKRIGMPEKNTLGGLKILHMDSWEMGSQNWTPLFRKEFIKRRGYDPLPYYPVYAGKIVQSVEVSERFLWDLRQTCNELILENHASAVKRYAHQHNLKLSIEPYDLNPTADLELGAIADIPMCEYWSEGYGFNTSFSCIEATSIAHIMGEPLVQAESFTAGSQEGWKQYPGSMKNEGDWAFATGINKFYFHTFQHKSLNDSLKPGMTMGIFGVHWDRKQTWWPMVATYHRYISRCQYILQQGKAVADILYLSPEGSPNIFTPPPSAMKGDEFIPDRRGYNFDGCSPTQLYTAYVKDNRITFPSGASYRVLVLPAFETMTPALLQKIKSLVSSGAMIIGAPPVKSPGLTDYPRCDQTIRSLVEEMWGTTQLLMGQTVRHFGKGTIIWGGPFAVNEKNAIYPSYNPTAGLLDQLGLVSDFESMDSIRYTHRSSADWDIYFVANSTNSTIKTTCKFRSTKGSPELWDPLTGQTRALPEFWTDKQQTGIDIQFEPYQSYFVVFAKSSHPYKPRGLNFYQKTIITKLNRPWDVTFDPKWGGPANVRFEKLTDWKDSKVDGIKYYSGIATYHQTFDVPDEEILNGHKHVYIDLGEVDVMASVKLNGKDLGVLWTAPWRIDITGLLKQKHNTVEIEVANLWANRLIGDENFPDDGVHDGKFPEWLINGTKRTSGRYTFTTLHPYTKKSPLLKSGLIGPVTIEQEEN